VGGAKNALTRRGGGRRRGHVLIVDRSVYLT